MAGLEGIDATSMELVDALQAQFIYDEAERLVKPLIRHADFVPVAVHRDAVAAAVARGQNPQGDAIAMDWREPEAKRCIARVRFGMPGFQGRLITNARDDKLTEARTWKSLLGKPEHHCLTAVSYVVERAAKDADRVGGIEPGATYRIQRRDGRPMIVPGLCAVRKLEFSSTGNVYHDLAHVQITSDANAFIGKIHDRFVVDLDRVAADAWMAGNDVALAPADDDAYEMVPVSSEVWTRRKDPDVVAPTGDAIVWDDVAGKGQQALF
ncbi:MAG: SOS response-associated peptidase family protein [Thermoplasmatota archaeon]